MREMLSFRSRETEKETGISPKAEVGEIDTRAPFQSVKAAVSLFGEVTVSKKPSFHKKFKPSSENALDTETQLVLLQKEISKLKQQRESANNTKARALTDLEKAKKTLDDLTYNLQTVTESKQSATKAVQEIKEKSKKIEVENSNNVNGTEAWKMELEHTRMKYRITMSELNVSKKELTKIRQDFDAILEAKLTTFQQAAEAQCHAKQYSERVHELSREIASMQELVQQLKNVASQTRNEQAKLVAERDSLFKSYRTSKEETENKLMKLKEEANSERIKKLEIKLEDSTEEIEVLQEEIRKARAQEMDAIRVVTVELNEATKKLQEVLEEENSLQNIVKSFRGEMEDLKRQQDELKAKEREIESLTTNHRDKIKKNKTEIKDKTDIIQKELKESEEIILKSKQLSEEAESARNEADKTIKNVNKLRQETAHARRAAEEARKKLQLALVETKEAKVAQKRAHDEMKLLSETQEETFDSNTKKIGKVKLTVQEFKNLSNKVEESDDLADKKEAEARAELEIINSRKNEVDEKLEAYLKAIEEIKAATEMAFKNAEMAESAKSVIEVELCKWRQSEQ